MTIDCYVFGVRMTYRWVLDWMIGFIDTLSIHLVTTINESAITIPILCRPLLHTLASSVCYSLHLLFPGNGFITVPQ
jgi:hypothetical protein